MLRHILAAYQNSLLNAWRKLLGESILPLFFLLMFKTMVDVAERFKGYQYYEFSVLKHLRPDSRKLAGRGDGSDGEDSTSRTISPRFTLFTTQIKSSRNPNDFAAFFYFTARTSSCALDFLNDANLEPATESMKSVPTEEELDRQLDVLFRTDDTDGLRTDEFAQFQSCQTTLSLPPQPLDQNSRPDSLTFEWNSVFEQLDNNNNNEDNENNNTASQSDLISSEIATAITEVCERYLIEAILCLSGTVPVFLAADFVSASQNKTDKGE
ncbi:hypothetical protein D915_001695 [Fasciola hepatica]|uniref:Uncharacterized protein n=1 Tax=Fasciola hepatica TaxID=6192 RepID=A0A4E0RJ93_FASHE|nr:hypothetical protein D915_001695 [Fasciola hepatica]